jgi:hypothetical protein
VGRRVRCDRHGRWVGQSSEGGTDTLLVGLSAPATVEVGTDTLLVGLSAPATVEVGTDTECSVAGGLAAAGRGAIDGLGCSDCRCVTHLAGAPARRPLVTAVTRAHRRAQEG